MKKLACLLVALVAISSAKADLVVDSLGIVTMDKSYINEAIIDTLSAQHITVADDDFSTTIRPDGLVNLTTNSALLFDHNKGLFYADNSNPHFHNNRTQYTFSIGSSRNNLYLFNCSSQPNSTAITATITSNNTFYIKGNNLSTNKSNFHIAGDGTFYSMSGYITASDGAIKENISSIGNVLDNINDINPVSYNLIADTNTENKPTQRGITDENNDVRIRYGFIAQELEEIFPNVVYTMPDGEKGIAYQELIPILVSAIQELQAEVESLKSDEPYSPQRQQAPASLQDAIDNNSAILMQNTPNPFNQATEIGYRLPDGTATAMIMLCDMNGKMLQSYPLATNINNGVLTIHAGSYTPGMYLYTLIVDGVQIDTKQMIILAH